MIAAQNLANGITNWLKKCHGTDTLRVSIVFSIVQTRVDVKYCRPKVLQEIRDRLDGKFKNSVRYIGVTHFHLTIPYLSDNDVDNALVELSKVQESLKIELHIGVGIPSNDASYSLTSATNAWLAAVRLNNGQIVNYDKFFSRDEILDYIRGVGGSRFELHFQPKLCAETELVAGYEALARLILTTDSSDKIEILNPNKNNFRSCDFLEAIRANGLQAEFDSWLIKSVAPIVNENNKISINLLASSLTQHLYDLIKNTVSSGLPFLEIEVLEHEELTQDSFDIISQLTVLGISFSLDDFGKGVSNIDALRKIPPHSTIKVDLGFVRGSDIDNEEGRQKQQTQLAIAQLAKTYNHKLVFEGVENDQICSNIKNLIGSIDIKLSDVKLQGYFRNGQPKAWGAKD